MSSRFAGVLTWRMGALATTGIRFRRAQGRNPESQFDATGWVFSDGDRVHPGRFVDPGRDCLVLSSPDGAFLGLLGSHSSALDFGVATYSIRHGSVPPLDPADGAWVLGAGDRFIVANLESDGRDELIVVNGAGTHLGVVACDGDELFTRTIQKEAIPFSDTTPGWLLSPGDRFYPVGDPAQQDVVVVSPEPVHMGLLSWDNGFITSPLIRDGMVPFSSGRSGWILNPEDVFVSGDFDGDGRNELLAFNGSGQHDHLGVLDVENDQVLAVAISRDQVWPDQTLTPTPPTWNLNAGDKLIPVRVTPGSPRHDLFVANAAGSHVAMLGFSGDLVTRTIVANTIPGVGGTGDWVLDDGDRFLRVDVDGDGLDEIVVVDRDGTHIGVLTLTPTSIATEHIVAEQVPYRGDTGWNLSVADQHWAGDLSGNGREEVFVLSPAAPHPYISLAIRLNMVSTDVNPLVQQLADIVRPRGIQVELASRGTLALPTLKIVDTGECTSGSVTADQMQLYAHRDDMAPHDIGVYFVDGLNPGGPGFGCASNNPLWPGPGCVLTPSKTPGLMSHEVCHVLGLHHVDAIDMPNNVMVAQVPQTLKPLSPSQADAVKDSTHMSH